MEKHNYILKDHKIFPHFLKDLKAVRLKQYSKMSILYDFPPYYTILRILEHHSGKDTQYKASGQKKLFKNINLYLLQQPVT